MKIKHKLLILVGAVVFAGISCLNLVFADGKKFAISPMSQKVILVPGEVYKGGITVSNPADSTENFNYVVSMSPYSLAEDTTSDDNLGGSDFDTRNQYNQIADWIKVDNPKGEVAPNEQKTVSFEITVPEAAPAGGQYAALIVQEDKDAAANENNIAVDEIMRMAHIIYAEVAGETKRDGEILENNIPGFFTSSPLRASSMVKNKGNVDTQAEYTLQVWPLFSDEEICTNEEKPTEIRVMPETNNYHMEECNVPSIGIFRVKQTVKIFDEVSETEKTVLFCPVWILFIIIFVVIAIIIWIVMKIRSRNSAKNREL